MGFGEIRQGFCKIRQGFCRKRANNGKKRLFFCVKKNEKNSETGPKTGVKGS
jgi:hypothetical protein